MQKILILLLLTNFIFIGGNARATTFTSFQVARQVEDAHYVVRGRIGANWTKIEPSTQRPYTYWELNITDVYSDAKLSGMVPIRQPGGEVGEIGYGVAGVAHFNEGEDVVVMLRDTPEEAKEVIGLQSGKYIVFKRDDGSEGIKSSFGIELKNENGETLSPDAFQAFVARVNTRSLTDADKKIVIDPGHGLHVAESDDHALKPSSPDKAVTVASATIRSPGGGTGNNLESAANPADRNIASQADSTWIGFFVATVFLVCVALVFRLLTRKPQL